jgi:lipopolysaccharide export system protein LptC
LNAIFNIPNYLKIGLLLIAVISLWMLFTKPDPPKTEAAVHYSIDFGMTDFKLTVMDINGKPSRVIKGETLYHYPENNDWIIESDHAETQGEGENILLTGNVIITNKDQPEVQLLTEILNLDTVNNTAYTDQPVTMKSPHGDTHSVGFHAALQEETINLHSRVRGQYNAPPVN